MNKEMKTCTKFKKGMTPWNKGHKKATVFRIQKAVKMHGIGRGNNPISRKNLHPIVKHSLESKKKISEANHRRNFSGENHPRWISDRTKLAKRQERNDMACKEWRKQVWLRDNYKCKIANPDCKGRIEAHHILGWTKYPELRYEINNGITLCHAHHPRKREDESKLSPYFKKLVAEMN